MNPEKIPSLGQESPLEVPTFNPGQQITAKYLTHGGVEGAKYLHDSGQGRLFITRDFIEGENGYPESNWYTRHNNLDGYSPDHLYRKIYEAKIFSQIAKQANLKLERLPLDIQIIPVNPIVLLRSIPGRQFNQSELELEVIETIDQSTFEQPGKLAKLLNENLIHNISTKSGFVPSHRLALGYPFIKNINTDSFLINRLYDSVSEEQYRQSKYDGISLIQRQAIYRSIMTFNAELLKSGLFWRDQGKDNSLLLPQSNDGSLKIVISDVDATVFNRKKYRRSDIFLPELDTRSTPCTSLEAMRELVGYADPQLAELMTTDRQSYWQPEQTLSRWLKLLIALRD